MKAKSTFPQGLPASRKHQGAYSVVELLIVMSIMLLLAGTSLIGLAGSPSRSLDTAGNKVVDLVNEARQNSISQHAMTALVLITAASDPSGNAAIDNRLFLIMQFEPGSASWQPVSPWELLPDGVVVDSDDSTTFMQQPTLLTPPSSVTYRGVSMTPAAYQVFLPDGHLAGSSETPALRLVSGRVTSGGLSFTSSATGGTPQNYYDITINPYTGMPIVDRP